MERDPLAFRPTDMAANAARAFERYDLVSLPVVNDRGKLVGRLTVDAVVDFIRVTADKDALAMAGLRGAEDTVRAGLAIGAQSVAVAVRQSDDGIRRDAVHRVLRSPPFRVSCRSRR